MTTFRTSETARAAGIRLPVTIIAVLIAAAILVISHIYVTIPLVPDVAEEFGVDTSAAAWTGSGFGFAFAVGNLIFPTLSDRIDPRRVMAFGLIAVALAGLGASFAGNLEWLIAARVVQGFVAPALPPVALVYLPQVLPERISATAMAVLTSCFLLAGVVGQSWAVLVSAALDWRGALWGLVPPLLIVAVLVMRLPAVPRVQDPVSYAALVRSLATLSLRPRVQAAYLAALSILLVFVGMYIALEQVSSDLGASGPVGGILLRLPGLPGIVLGWFAGRFIRRHGPHLVGAAAFVMAAVGLGIEALGGALWLILIGSTVFVAGLAAAIPAAVTVVGQASGTARGAGMAGYAFLIGAGASLAPMLVSALAPLGFAGTCAVLAAALILPAAALVVTRS